MNKIIKADKELAVGKNDIVIITSGFEAFRRGAELTDVDTPVSQILHYRMSSQEIEREMHPQLCTLSDVYAFLKNASPEFKKGHSNLFFMSTKIVTASYSVGWQLRVFERDISRKWLAGSNVFSPASAHVESADRTQTNTLPDMLEINGVRYKKI